MRLVLGLLLLWGAGPRLGIEIGMGFPTGGLGVYHRASSILGLDIGFLYEDWDLSGELNYGGLSGGVWGYEVGVARIGGYLSHTILPLGADQLILGLGGGMGYIERRYLGGQEAGWAPTGKLGLEFVRMRGPIRAGTKFDLCGLWNGTQPAMLLELKLRLGYGR
jgi:hypothetical protein